ncbi:hypothetical protein BaRGS_00028580 [Batillaria attramentaria]|uniref:N-acetylgalactosaminide beta-1,3-galactosyltransferase n=1 Tax=Batillaria attramentaria TaxID=370345 RepID=A0ABD0JZP6_9CAEN
MSVSVDDTAARALRETMRVLCWIPACESDIKKLSLQAINETWVQRCDGHVFFIETDSSSAWPDVISLGLAQESYNHLTEKTQVAIAYLYQRYLNEYDWFLKADVNSYVIMENLRLLLSRYDPKNPVYLGQLYNGIWGGPGFMGGGAGYALSREALRQMVDQGYRKGLCSTEYYNHAEDKHVGECLYKIGVGRHYSLDVHGRESFHMDGPLQMIAGPLTDAMRRFFYFPQSTGPECCSEATISFHGLTPETIRVLENLVYRISVYGRQQNITYLQKLFVPKQIW